jgi:hypothetical protein
MCGFPDAERRLALLNLWWCSILASARLLLVALSSDEPHANAENNEAGKYRYLYQQVDFVHGFRTVRIHKARRLTMKITDEPQSGTPES